MTGFKNFGRALMLTTGIITFALAGCGDDDNNNGGTRPTERETLTTAMEVPTPTGAANATGTFEYRLDSTTRVMTYTLTVANLTGPATAAHIHKAPIGMSGPVVVPLTTPATGSATGTATLTEEQLTDLNAGNLYVNVHTAANPMGEVRVQLDGK